MAKVAESACGSYLTPSSASHPEEVQTQGSLPIIGAVTITRETGLWTSVGPSPLHKNPTPNHQRHTGHGRRLPVSRQTHSGVCTFLPQLRPDRSPRHQEQGRGRVRQRPLLARTARPDQPTLPAQRHDPGTGGRRDAPSRLSGHFPDRQDRGHPYPPLTRRSRYTLPSNAKATSSPQAQDRASRFRSSYPSSTASSRRGNRTVRRAPGPSSSTR